MTYDSSAPLSLLPTTDMQLRALEAQVQALQVEAAHVRTLFQDAPHPAFLLNDQGRIVEVNTQGAALLGSIPALLLGRPLLNALVPDSQAALTSLLSRVLSGLSTHRREVCFAGPNSQPLDMVLVASLYVRADGVRLCHLSATDVTAFKAAHQSLLAITQGMEHELRRQTVRLKQLGDEFRDVTLAAERELGTTLTRAQNFLTLLERQTEPDDRLHSLSHVATAVQHTQGLLTSLKGYMQARMIRARLRPIDLNRVLREVLKELEPLQSDRVIQLSRVPLPTLQGDHQVFQIIFHEYLANALKFTRTRPQAQLRFLVKETEKDYWIGLEDNGVGFNMRQKEKAFELFGRLHPAELYEGAGVGLAVVRRLCERFGGRAWGEGKVEQGATFWFAWPKEPRGD
ncbi:PAS domain-containing protein [Deinococcus sp. HMF7604]|uniref:sensor histidine kinase n=1 Tax=Deinococcus betulae TaxID=2873312 RepID=UPI001CCA3B7C|nr:ATP-binding protein [Deinococcus betulae]MBZ9749796.1 PAS domain-containing protein [Deinococcus betulae]